MINEALAGFVIVGKTVAQNDGGVLAALGRQGADKNVEAIPAPASPVKDGLLQVLFRVVDHKVDIEQDGVVGKIDGPSDEVGLFRHALHHTTIIDRLLQRLCVIRNPIPHGPILLRKESASHSTHHVALF